MRYFFSILNLEITFQKFAMHYLGMNFYFYIYNYGSYYYIP